MVSWKHMNREQRDRAILKADPLFIHAHWEELTTIQQFLAITIRKFVQELPPNLLPKYIVSELLAVRNLTAQQVTTWLENIPIEKLPGFLADADPAIREIAEGLLEELEGGGK